MNRDHRKLRAFTLADELVVGIYKATKSFPIEERYGLQSQIRRACISVPTNIVEGCARPSEGDYLRFLDIAFGSSRELSYLILLAIRLEFLDASLGGKLHAEAEQVAGTLAALRHSLRPDSN
jgi:four helix bundle protein